MNKSYLLSLSKGTNMKYLTMSNPCGQSRIMCFEKKRDALRCKEYIIAYKTAFGHWPALDMSNNERTIKYRHEGLKANDAIYQQVYINEIDENTFDYFCRNKKMSFLVCKSFNTSIEGNKHNLDFTGEEYVCDDENMFSNITNLNNILKQN